MSFTAGSAIRFGWETFKKRPWFFVGATIVIVDDNGTEHDLVTARNGNFYTTQAFT